MFQFLHNGSAPLFLIVTNRFIFKSVFDDYGHAGRYILTYLGA